MLRELEYPVKRIEKESYILEHLKILYYKFLDKINKLEENKYSEIIIKNKDNIATLCQDILDTIKIYLKGYPAESYKQLENTIRPIKFYFDRMKVERYKSNFSPNFYRVRKSDKKLTRKELFHIPFEERYKVSAYRYSISGLPCLYMGNTPYVCLLETDLLKTKDKGVYISMLKVKDISKLKILDLYSDYKLYAENINKMRSSDDNFMKNLKDYNKLEISTRVINYPIIASCSIKKKEIEYSYNFKEEYIFPQLILQYVSHSSSIDGIRYLSTINSNPDHFEICQNYVFPASNVKKKKGFCTKLTNQFMISDPIDCEKYINKNNIKYMNDIIRKKIGECFKI